MKKLLIFFAFVIGVAVFLVNVQVGVFHTISFFDPVLEGVKGQSLQDSGSLRKQEDLGISVDTLEKEVSTPPPLRGTQEVASPTLTDQGVLQWTNEQRENNGFVALQRDLVLDAIATVRLEEMFAKQYFAHVAPDGSSVSVVAGDMGYEYIAIGENLALGNYASDEALVQAWMDSPGHRANILNDRYEEIGIAVRKGMFEGHSTWIGVQVFSLPLSACPLPDKDLASQIDLQKLQVQQLEEILNTTHTELEIMQPKRGSAYNKKVNEYNQLVDQYNVLIGQTQKSIAEYNEQVNAFNDCARP